MKPVLLVLTCLHAALCCSAQCFPSPQAWLDEIASIRNDQTAELDKIKRLDLLEKNFIRCGGSKDSVYAVLIHRLGEFYTRISSYEDAIRYTKEAVSINSDNKGSAQRSFLAHSYYNLGVCYNAINLQADSRQYFDSCISIATQYLEKNFIALLAYERLAFSLFQAGDFQKALDNADAGMLLAIKNKDAVSEALMLMQKTQAYLQLNEIELAEKNAAKMITLLRTGGNEGVSYLPNAYSVYAHLLTKQKKLPQAIAFYKNAYDGNKEKKMWDQCSGNLQDLGLLYDRDLNDPENAMKCYREALSLARESAASPQVAAIYNNIGTVMWRQKKFRQALVQYQKGLAAITNLSDVCMAESLKYNTGPPSLSALA